MRALDALRQPLESGHVVVARSAGVVRLPARFLMVLAANPCPCGRHTLHGAGCECPPSVGPSLPGAALRAAARPGGPAGRGRAGHPRRPDGAGRPRASRRPMSPPGCGRPGRGRRPGSRAHPGRPTARSPAMSCGPAGSRRRGRSWQAERDMERGLLTARGLDRVLRVAWTVADLRGARPPGGVRRRGGPGAADGDFARGLGAGPGFMTPGGLDAGPGIRAPDGLDEGQGISTPGVRERSREAGWARPAVGDRERLARAALTRVLEPGDERGGRWLREVGAVGLIRRITARDGTAEQLPGHDGEAAGRLPATGRGRRPRAGPGVGRRRRAAASSAPATVSGPASSTTWATPGRSASGCGAGPICGSGRCARSRWSAPGPVPRTGRTWRRASGAGLAERGWVVVSGAAFGVDGAAHRGALAAGGATMAVLACGVDVAYPARARRADRARSPNRGWSSESCHRPIIRRAADSSCATG